MQVFKFDDVPDVQLLVVDGSPPRRGRAPHGSELVGHLLGHACGGPGAVRATATGSRSRRGGGRRPLPGVPGREGRLHAAALDQELVLGVVQGRLAQPVVRVEQDLLVPIYEQDRHVLGAVGGHYALVGTDQVPAGLGGLDLRWGGRCANDVRELVIPEHGKKYNIM